MKYITFLLLLHSISTFSQNAVFYADLTSHLEYKNHTKSVSEKYSNERWIINGVELNYGDTIQIKADSNKLDTILFKHYSDSEFTSIITNIRNPYTYRLKVNTCCPTFNTELVNDSVQISNQVLFQLTSNTQRKILAVIDENGKFISNQSSQPVKSICDSALSSEVNEIKILEVEDCIDLLNCINLRCLTLKNKDLPTIHDKNFKVIWVLAKFKYLSLDSDELRVLLDPISNIIELK